MANIEVKSAFVEEAYSSPAAPTFALKVAEPHSRKDESGKWQTVARTFYKLRASRDSGVNFSSFTKGDRITFSGAQKTEVSEHNGKTFYTLTVWVDSIAHADGATPAPVQAVQDTFYAQTEQAATFIDDGAPF